MEVSFISKDEFNRGHMSFLQDVGIAMLLQFDFNRNEAIKIISNLLERHSEKQRHYHDLSHLYNLYLLIIEYQHLLKKPILIEAAIWFHDAIYIPKNKNNEVKSAELAVEILQGKKLPFAINDLKLLIESTVKHQPLKKDSDFHYFLDFDLGILAVPSDIYQKYVAAIRQEYSMYPNFLYKIGRKKVLKSFLKRERIYFSSDFFEKYEGAARENILQEING